MKTDEINIRDPFVLLDNDKYYLYGTTDKNCWNGKAEGFNAYVSEDLNEWAGPYTVFKNQEDFWADENFWAPEVYKYQDKYYMFASFFKKGKPRATQILVSDSPLGLFKPLTDEPITPKDWWCLDGTLYVENSKPYIVFCHEWLQIQDGQICMMQLSDDLTKAVSEPKILFSASESTWSTPIDYGEKGEFLNYVTDGPFMWQLMDGTLMMLWSSNSATSYTIGLAKSDNGSIFGNWTHVEEPLFRENGGHGMVFKTKENELMLAIHQPNNPSFMERPKFFKLIETNCSLKILSE